MLEENSNIYIVDASFVLARLLPDENSQYVDKMFEGFAAGEINFLSSPILSLEIISGLKSAYPKRVSKKQALALLADFINFNIKTVEFELEKVLELSIETGLSAYDASYVWLTRERNIPLLTLDKRLSKLAKN